MLTNTTLVELGEKQADLDSFIEQKVTNETFESLFKKRVMAFLVEVGEYANEERAFKFWSQKQPSELTIRLEEYVDGLHFLLSLANSLKFDWSQFQPNVEILKTEDPIDNYLNLINYLDLFIQKIDASSFTDLSTAFLNIMILQDYSETDVLFAYDKKNSINYQRQNSPY